jgi:hypothetical protein
VSTQHDRASTLCLRHSAPMRDMQAQSSPSAEAIAVGRNLAFDAISEVLDQAQSFALSAREAAYRGSQTTLEIHLRQLRDCTVAACATFREYFVEVTS